LKRVEKLPGLRSFLFELDLQIFRAAAAEIVLFLLVNPSVSLVGSNRETRVHQDQDKILSGYEILDFLATSGHQSRRSVKEKRNIASKGGGRLVELFRTQSSGEQFIEPIQHGRSVAGPSAQACTHRNPLLYPYFYTGVQTATRPERLNRPGGYVLAPGKRRITKKPQGIVLFQRSDMDSVEQRNRMDDGEDFVIPAGLQCLDLQMEVHLGGSVQDHLSPLLPFGEYTQKAASLSMNAQSGSGGQKIPEVAQKRVDIF
jgi:hypothetical protein